MHLYEPRVYATERPPSAWWARRPEAWEPGHAGPCVDGSHIARADLVVIGAGVTGLSAALEAVESHGAAVLVLDRAAPGWGASGRAGGFVCLGGSRLGLAELAARHGLAAARDMRKAELAAIETVADSLERYGIDARQGPDGEACIAISRRHAKALREDIDLAQQLPGPPPVWVPARDLDDHGLHLRGAFGARIEKVGFPIDPLAYTLGLRDAARAAGVDIRSGCDVTGLRTTAAGFELRGPGLSVRARRVLVATNGYGDEAVPPWLSGRILPVISSVLVTEPMDEATRGASAFRSALMSYDSRVLLHYFRHLPDGRFLFGMRGGIRGTERAERRTAARVERRFRRMFPAWREVPVAHRWSGLACLTRSGLPFVGPVPGADGLFAAFGYHGNGLAFGSLAGRSLAAMALGGTPRTPALVARPPAPFRPRRWRRAGLALAYLAAGISDARP
ncbi:MAG: FAD-binding oxidoreductase [Alphaproteobacteria bacterium]|nr:MAG: FAD-binding oxidoreductase [Alphaproteobacteria bacterium]